VRQSTNAARRVTSAGLKAAVHRSKPLSRAGVLERLFTLAFKSLVYPQIWEDPVVDMKALNIGPGHEVIAIASGGCNVLSYLAADPAGVTAVDLNGAHIALGRLKICAAQNLPDYDSFFRFFARANARANIAAYDRRLRAKLDPAARAYWDKRTTLGRRRIGLFARNFYRHGLLGHILGAGHTLARLHGLDPSIVLKARTLDEQRALYHARLAPIFKKPLVRWLMKQPASLYGLGIPPAQYRALAADSPQGISAVLSERLERLACGFDIAENYFAWQAFGRRYAPGPDPALPPYLQRQNFEAVRRRSTRVRYVQRSFTDILRESPALSFDRYALLDAQDWMNNGELTALWTEITRTARPGARVIFRTAAAERLLPGRVPESVLDAWRYEEELSRELEQQDRSSIYGAFHLYALKERA
jgi:S-adenosylmethionine-diacylglycerol 3-amino-3-carboxypropyl transferase